MFTEFKIFNRPIAPHLSIYIPQFSSLFSIWHRISGVTLSILSISLLILIKSVLSLSFLLEFFFFLYSITSKWVIGYFSLLILILFLYHFFNGIKYITWDLGFFLNTKYLYTFSFLLVTSLFFVIIKY